MSDGEFVAMIVGGIIGFVGVFLLWLWKEGDL